MIATLDPLLHDEVCPLLEGGERLLWTGRPDPRRTALVKIGRSLTVVVFTLLLYLVYRSGLPAYGSQVGTYAASYSLLPEVLSAGALLLLLSGTLLPLFSYRSAKMTVYAVTDRRVLSFTRGRLARSIWYEDMQSPLLEPGTGDRGDIHFRGRVRADGSQRRLQFPHFLGVEAAESVHQLIIEKMTSADGRQKEDRVAEDYLELLLRRKGGLEADLSREWGPAGADDAYQLLHSQRIGPAKG